MSGWVLMVNGSERFEKQVSRFKKVFSVKGLPPLQTKKIEIGKGNMLLSWAWGNREYFPDLTVYVNDTKDKLILMEGVVTDLGAYGQADTDQVLTAKKILDLWNSGGKDIPAELNGSFSIVIFDVPNKETVCVTDRIASRALWYSREKYTWYFGNFPAAVAIFREEIHLDGAGLWSLLATSRPIAGRSLFYEVRSLQAGQTGYFDASGEQSIVDWYELRYKPEKNVSTNEWGERITGGLRESAGRISAYSSAPYLFLSGGLDSRIAAGAFDSAVKTLTLTTRPNMNTRVAERVAQKLGIEHKTIIRDACYYLDTFTTAALISGGNYNISHAHFIKPVINITAEKGKAAFLLGDLLENFNKHYFKSGIIKILNNLQREDFPALFNRLYSYSYGNFDEIEGLLNPWNAKKCRQNWSDELIALSKKVYGVSDDTRDVLDALFRWYNNNFCPTNLMHDCMKPFAEVRNLMVDNHMIDLVLRVPSAIKTRGGLHQKTLKYLDKGLLFIPDSNFWLPPMVPEGLKKIAKRIRPILGKTRRKILSIRKGSNRPVVKTEGSWHMLHELFRKDTRYKHFIQNILFDNEAIPGEIFDSKSIQKHWREFLAGDLSRTFIVHGLLTFGLVHQLIPARGITFD